MEMKEIIQYPNEELLINYIEQVTEPADSFLKILKRIYNNIKKQYNNSIDFISKDIMHDSVDRYDYVRMRIQEFLCLYFKYDYKSQKVIMYQGKEKYLKALRYFNRIDENFIRIWNEKNKDGSVNLTLFKFFLYNSKFDIYNIERRNSVLRRIKFNDKYINTEVYFLDDNIIYSILNSNFADKEKLKLLTYRLDRTIHEYKNGIQYLERDKNLKYPDEYMLLDFMKVIFNASDYYISRIKSRYSKIKDIYKSPLEFLDVEIEYTESNRVDLRIQMFLSIKYRIEFKSILGKIQSNQCIEVLEYFDLIDEMFIDAWNGDEDDTFNSYLLKLFLYNNEFDIFNRETIDTNIINFINEYHRFSNDKARVRRFIYKLNRVMSKYKGIASKENPICILRNMNREYLTVYGTENESVIKIIDLYIDLEYERHSKNTTKSLNTLSLFFKWRYSKKGDIKDINEICSKDIEGYVEFLEHKKIKQNTKYKRNFSMNKFIIWLVKKNYLSDKSVLDLVSKKIKFKTKDEEKPRMFESRKHFMQVVNALHVYEPIDELERAKKNLSIIVSATGLRLSECRWLDYECLIEKIDNLGVVQLGSKDKNQLIYKKTTIQKWGLEALEDAKISFENRKNIKIYNKKINQYVYSLFEIDGEIISESALNSFLRTKIFNNIVFLNDKNEKVDYSGIKFHAFRHQKGNDIYRVTNGNLKRVQIGLSHRKISMSAKYTRKEMEEKKKKIIMAIESGKIVGKGSSLIKKLLDVELLPEEYLNIYKKLNISKYFSISKLADSLKFVGFGFCNNKNCKYTPICEGCNYFITNEDYIDILKQDIL